MAQKTKAQLEADLKEARETIELQYRQIQQLQQQVQGGVEASPVYRQALQDAEAARADADMWRGLYEALEEKHRKPPAKKKGRPITVTEGMKQEIREKHSQGASIRQLAKEYGVAIASVQRAIKE